MKVCVIGCGGIAASSHGPALARYAAGRPWVELAACCDVDAARAGRFAAAFGFRKVYGSAQEMIAAEKPDAAFLLVPPEHTAALACDLLRQGIPLLLEKPPGLTLAEAAQIQQAAGQSGTPHMVAFNRQFTPLVQRFKEIFAARFQPGDIQRIHYEMARVGRADPDFTTTAIHGIDGAAFLAGSAYRRVDFHYQPFPALGRAVANVTVSCAFQSGAEGLLSFLPVTGMLTERATVYLHDHVFSLALPLSGGSDHPGRLVYLEKGRQALEITGRQALEEGFSPEESAEDWALNGFYEEDAAFLDALRAGERPPAGIETTLPSVAIMEAMRERRPSWEDQPSRFER